MVRDHEDMKAALATWREGGPSAVDVVIEYLPRLLEIDQVCVYDVEPTDNAFSVGLLRGRGFDVSRVKSVIDSWTREGRFWGAFDPLRPSARDRNRAVRQQDLNLDRIPPVHGRRTIIDDFAWAGIAREQIRVIIADGPQMLAWVGGFRDDGFTEQDKRRLQSVVPAMQFRLRQERMLSLAEMRLSALDSALEALGSSAFLVDRRGRIVHANSAGWRELKERSMAPAFDGSSVAAGRWPPQFEAITLKSDGVADHWLVIRRPRHQDEDEARIAAFARRHQLTPRQTEVLGLIVRGHPNRSIAALLRCSVRTVEVHVCAILERTGAASRAELIASILLRG